MARFSCKEDGSRGVYSQFSNQKQHLVTRGVYSTCQRRRCESFRNCFTDNHMECPTTSASRRSNGDGLIRAQGRLKDLERENERLKKGCVGADAR
jgi:hypothetical protein